jgi:hypothetical protein
VVLSTSGGEGEAQRGAVAASRNSSEAGNSNNNGKLAGIATVLEGMSLAASIT